MSFILDAIAKSERERQQQEIPDARILAIPADDTTRSRNMLPYLLIGSLLLIIIVLLIWMQANRFGWNAGMSSQINVDKSFASSQSQTQLDLKQLNQAPTPGRVISPTDASKAPTPGLTAQSTDSLVSNDAVTRNDETPPGPVDDVQDIAKAGDINSNSSVDGEVSSSLEILDGSPGANPATMPATEQADSTEIYRLRDLPEDVRRDLPPVVFKGHLYSKNPNVSYVMVEGGRSVVAGQQIVDEVLLHKVTPQGVIVDFRGFLIEIGILQNWSLK